jgi:hypothetical protein
MPDEFLTFASTFDWIIPTVAFVQDFFNGPVSDFGISTSAGWNRGDIKRLLKKHGVRMWGLMLNLSGDMVMFTVPSAQAGWAYSLLQREGVPVLYAPAAVANPSLRQSSKEMHGANPLESIFKVLDRLDRDF